MRTIRFVVVFCITVASTAALGADPVVDNPPPIRIVVWDEQQESQKKVYDNYLGNAIADHLKGEPRFAVTSVSLKDKDMGLADATLGGCDVLIWWAHQKHGKIPEHRVRRIADRVQSGKMSLIVLHSAHFASPFMELMDRRAMQDAIGSLPESDRVKAKASFFEDIRHRRMINDKTKPTPWHEVKRGEDGSVSVVVHRAGCIFPRWKNHGEPSRIKALVPKHPIAAGLPETFIIPHTEMYDEHYHVPEPDVVVFEETWEAGHRFRSGMVWRVGKGRVFYFRPGHETHAVYKQDLPLRVLTNAARWLGEDAD